MTRIIIKYTAELIEPKYIATIAYCPSKREKLEIKRWR